MRHNVYKVTYKPPKSPLQGVYKAEGEIRDEDYQEKAAYRRYKE